MFKNKSNIKPSLGSTINTNHPLAQGLVGCWLFNEQTGNKIYDLINKNESNLLNGTSFSNLTDTGVFFDGTNDYIQHTPRSKNLEFQYNIPFTIHVLTRVRSAVSGTGYIVTNRGVDGSGIPYSGWGIARTGNTIMTLVGGYTGPTWQINNISESVFINSVLDKWATITYVNTGITGQQKIYVNGINKSNSVALNDAYIINYENSNNPLNFARSEADGPGHYLNCDIAYTYIYNRALSAEEVLPLYEQPYQFIDPPAALKYYSYSQNRSLAASSITSEEKLPVLNTFNPSIKYKNISGLTKYAKDIEFNINTEYTKYSVINKPNNVNVTNFGTAGSTTYSYRVKALDETSESLATSAAITTTGNSVLSSTNFNRIKWDWVDGATGYKIYGRINGSEQLLTTTIYNHFDDDGSITPNGILNTNSVGGYDYKKLSLGPYYSLYTGNNKEDNYVKLREFDMARPMYDSAFQSQNVYCYFMDVTQWSDDITYIVSEKPSTSNPKRIALYKHFKSTGAMTFVGDIGLSVNYGTVNLKISLTRYSTGTVSASGTTVTGVGTSWKTSNFSKNSRIGFGSTEPALIDKWYIISDIPNDNTLTLSTTVLESVTTNTPFVIEELRIIFHTSNNLYMIKGITENDFVIGRTFSPTNTDPIGANIYLLSNPSIPGTIFAMPLKPMDDYNTQYVYCVYYIGTSNVIAIKKYNIRKDLAPTTQTLGGIARLSYTGYFADNLSFIITNVGIYDGNYNDIYLTQYISAWTYHYYGYFNITTPGTYTFYLQSDDASYLWLGATAESGYTTANAFLSEPGNHGFYEVSGNITLTAGPIFFRLICGDAGGGGGIRIEVAGPSITRTSNLTVLNPSATVTTFADPLVLTCGGTIPIVSRDRSVMNGVYCVPKHGIYKDTPVILFLSTSGVTVIKDSDIYANNIELFTHSYPLLFMIPNIDVMIFQSRSYQYNISYDDLLDRVIYPPSGYYLLKGYISTLGNIDKFVDTNMFSFSGIGNPSSKPNDVVDAIQDADFFVRSLNGWSYFIRTDSNRYRNTIFALPHIAHWTYSDKFKNYCISPIITLDKNTTLRRIHCNTNVLYGDNANSISAEPIRYYVRNNGIEDDSGKWVLIDSTGNIEHIQNTGKLQVRFESSLFLHYAKTKKIYGFSIEYDNKETISKGFSWNLSDSNTANAIVGFVQNELYKANPTFTIKYYNKSNNKLYLIQNTDRSSTGDFEYYASGWLKGYGPNQVGLRRRFVPTSALQKNIEYEVELEVK